MKNFINTFLHKIKSLILSSLKLEFMSLHKRIREEIRINNFTNSVLSSQSSGLSNKNYTENNIIVSLTTHSTRIHTVYLTIESIFNQTYKPNKVILWLNAPFTNDNLPETMNRLCKRGLEVRFVENIKSYCKLYYSLKEFPDDTIITIDDDFIYPFDFLERIIKKHISEPKTIFFYRGHKMLFEENGKLKKYRNWQIDGASSNDELTNFPNGNGGILYPPKSLHPEVLNQQSFTELCPLADDVWFRAMSLLNNTPCKKIELTMKPLEWIIGISGSQEIALWKGNIAQNENDAQIKKVFDKYNIWKILDNSH